MKNTFIYLLGLFFTFMVPTTAQAQSSGKGNTIEAMALSSTDFLVSPGQILSTNIEVRNTASKELIIHETLDLPKGWHSITSQGRFNLGGRSQTQRLLGIAVPGHAPAGDYEITYFVQSSNDYNIQDWELMTVTVSEQRGLNFIIEEQPTICRSGDLVSAKLRLYNEGNTPVTVDLNIERAKGLEASLSTQQLLLPVNTSRQIEVSIQTEEGSTRAERHNIIIAATDSKSTVSTRQVIHIETIPLASTKPELFHKLPSTVTLSAITDAESFTPQLEWKGQGSWGDSKDTAVNFLFRGPDNPDTGLFSQRETYRLQVDHKGSGLRLGDQSYRLTRLTQQTRYGRGAEIYLGSEKGGAKAYYVESLWGQLDGPDLGAQLHFKPVEKWRLSANALFQDSSADELTNFDDSLFSAQAEWAVNPDNDWTFELGTNPGSDEQSSWAYHAEGHGTLGKTLNYSIFGIHADPDYKGYYQDLNQVRANGNFEIRESIRFRAYYQNTHRNLALDPKKGTAQSTQNGEVEVRCVSQNRWCPGLSYRYISNSDRLRDEGSRDTHLVGLRISKAGDILKLDAKGEWGQQQEELLTSPAQIQRYEAFLRYQILPDRTLSASGRWNYHSLDDSLQRPTGTLGLDWRFSDWINSTINYRFGGVSHTTHQFDARLDWQVGRLSKLSIDARYNQQPQFDTTDFAAMLQLSRSLGIPTSRKRHAGAITGRIYDAESGEPMSNVIVQASGASGISNSQGRYTLHAVAPGNHTVSIDATTVGLDRVLIEDQQQSIQVEGGFIAKKDLMLTQGASLAGSIKIYRPTEQAEGVILNSTGSAPFIVGEGQKQSQEAEPTALAGVVIQLSKGTTKIERLSGPDGSYQFTGLTPGRWKMKVLEYNIPTFHAVQQAQRDLVIASGSSTEVHLRVVPKQRRIQIIDTGELTISSAQ